MLIITPADATFVKGFAADPEMNRVTIAPVLTPDLFGELTHPDAPMLQRTVAVMSERGCGSRPTPVGLTIGYMSRHQEQLGEAAEGPVVSSPLLAVPMLLATLPTERRVLVVYADASLAVDADIPGVTEEDRARLLIIGLECAGAFRDAVIDKTHPWSQRDVAAQIGEVIRNAQRQDSIGAVVLECGEMAAVADEVRAAVDVPVVDYHLVYRFFIGSVATE